jgi:hypothetical protein
VERGGGGDRKSEEMNERIKKKAGEKTKGEESRRKKRGREKRGREGS